MNINIRIVPDGFLCKLAVDPCYTILSIKKKVESFYGIPRDKQILVYESAILNDNDFLEDYDIQEDNTIRLVAEGLGSQFLKIEIKTLTGAIIEMQVKSFYLVEDLKLMLMAKSGIPPLQQRLICAGRQMEAGKNLASYRIETGSSIHLNKRPVKGKYETWKQVVDFKKKASKDGGHNKSLHFEGTIETDGVGVSIIKQNTTTDRKTPNSKTVIRKQGTKQDDDFEASPIEKLDQAYLKKTIGRCVLIDPDRRDLISYERNVYYRK
ncbi:hypothetical protein INT47_000824 [Mucor saturninus]|uniref:Ubiquitin-like domain-containing protein n=1 Tax=Mucor saturninus TaxID=64648 RepID=A0A8H7VF78_9FUNG|nr:hypothetical protein INT47_000824 [Mucor saturninus]